MSGEREIEGILRESKGENRACANPGKPECKKAEFHFNSFQVWNKVIAAEHTRIYAKLLKQKEGDLTTQDQDSTSFY